MIENGKIKEVGPASDVQAHAPAGVRTIDASLELALSDSRNMTPALAHWCVF